MAAATVSPTSALDLTSQGTFPVRLGNSVLRPTIPAKYLSLRYNHFPESSTNSPTEAQISQHSTSDGFALSLPVIDGTLEYRGHSNPQGSDYVLLCKGRSDNLELSLERLAIEYDFNLTSTPAQKSAERLAEQYPHLPGSVTLKDSISGDSDDPEAPPNASNPFDFRHFLGIDESPTKPSSATPSNSTSSQTRSTKHTAISAPAARSQPAKAPVLKKRKGRAAEKPQPKRVKADAEPADTPVSRPAKIAIPEVRLDRKASMRRPSIDDSGELILENETPVSEKRPARGAMALALSGQLKSGPFSLRSAASSPAGPFASPDPHAGEVDETGLRDDLAEGSDVVDEDEEDGDDADVEDMDLPSPAHGQISSTVPPAVAPGGNEEENDLEEFMQEAFAQGDEESEESEEE